MNILSIETSCDETSVSVVEASGDLNSPVFNVRSHLVLSQIKLHAQYGGVFPSLAKREHSKNLAPLIGQAFAEAGFVEKKTAAVISFDKEKIKTALKHEPELVDPLIALLESTQNQKPPIDLIAVTYGPGLEPALWVGISAAKILGEVWNVPVMPVNHMEGHIASVLYKPNPSAQIEFPALALLVSGGHTEIVSIPEWCSYQVVGQTKDDAVGEAYDKVARMMGLPYPGGPLVAKLAEEARAAGSVSRFNFPRPMIKSHDLDFSFSGLKTAVLYAIRDLNKVNEHETDNVISKDVSQPLSSELQREIAVEFEDAVVETLVSKTAKAIETHHPKTLILAGGVTANQTIKNAFAKLSETSGFTLRVPTSGLSTDNALMIALAAFVRKTKKPAEVYPADFSAEGNVQL